MSGITQRFERAALHYDQAASVQAQVAQHLVARTTPTEPPQKILDLGSGTGFVAQATRQRWPQASVTAIDASPAMLRQAQRKVPDLSVITDDAARIEFMERFDIIFSSMMLHWLPEPEKILRRWQYGLKPRGRLCVALLVEGSFREWQDLCRAHDVENGVWRFPSANFADGLAPRGTGQTITINYATAQDFLRRLKVTGTTSPRPDYKPMRTEAMRRLLAAAPKPFPVSYQVVYSELSGQGSI